MNQENVGSAQRLNAPVITIKHADLVPLDHSHYRRECPTCRAGFLPVRRNVWTGELLPDDYCTYCGQHYHYTDI